MGWMICIPCVVNVHRMCSIRQSNRPWRFKSGAVFERLDSFRARLHALQDMFQSAAAFGRLERIEIGGYQVCTGWMICDEWT